jgi:hypothetical protein
VAVGEGVMVGGTRVGVNVGRKNRVAVEVLVGVGVVLGIGMRVLVATRVRAGVWVRLGVVEPPPDA